jgi:uncharacterized protein DUF4158
VPVEFFSDEEAAGVRAVWWVAAAGGAGASVLSRRRGSGLDCPASREYNRLSFALQLTTVRSLGMFLADPHEVAGVVLTISRVSWGSRTRRAWRYIERRTTRFEPAEEIKQARGLRAFAEVGWLFERDVLLPGVTTLARLVARVRDEATQRLWDTLAGLLTSRQCRLLERLLTVPDGARFSDLERWRRGPAKPSGRNLEKAIARVAEIKALGLAGADLDCVVAHRRVVELARCGMSANARTLRRGAGGDGDR